MSEVIKQSQQDEHRLELVIGNLLRYCVIAVVIVVVAGAVLYLPTHSGHLTDYRQFRSEPDGYRSAGGILRLAFSGDALAIIQLGLVLLIVTPILRVALSAIAFIAEKDRLYVALTLVVLGLLLYSLLAG